MKKIYLILFIALIARIIHISYPVSGWHSWRQADTASIARNFYENGFNILYPKINWNADGTGYVESEFQIYPFLISILYSFFGVSDFWGRLVTVIFSLITIYGLFLIVKKIINEETALWAALLYSILPLNIYYGRAFMPDTAMLMCSVYGIYFFYSWQENNKNFSLLLSGIFISLAVLIKLPSLYLGLPLIFIVFKKYKWGFLKKTELYIYVLAVLLPVILWYYHSHQLFLNGGSSFGIWTYGQDKWGVYSLILDIKWYNDIFLSSIAERHLTYPGFILLLWGLFIKRKQKFEYLFDFWLLSIIIFIFIAAQAHLAQEYYTLPFTLPASVFIGKFFAKYFPLFGEKIKNIYLRNKYITIFSVTSIVLIITLSYLRLNRFYNSENDAAILYELTNTVQTFTGINDKIITIGDGNPVYLYHSHRFGWTALPMQINTEYVDMMRRKGATYIAGEKNIFLVNNSLKNLNFLLENYKIIKNETGYFIVDIR